MSQFEDKTPFLPHHEGVIDKEDNEEGTIFSPITLGSQRQQMWQQDVTSDGRRRREVQRQHQRAVVEVAMGRFGEMM